MVIPKINSAHGSETRNIINEIIKAINDRGLEILSESAFLNWMNENGVKHQGEWDNTKEYVKLSVVLHEGNSYTSVKHVPVGVDILNEDFWMITGNYNAQVEYYREETDKTLSVNENGILFSSLGAIPNNSNAGLNNMNVLYNAIEEDLPVFIDGIYHITGGSRTIDNDVILKGNVETSKIISVGTLFELSNRVRKIKVEGIYFESDINATTLFINGGNLLNIDEYIFKGNITYGNVRIGNFDSPININPDVVEYGIKKIRIEFNNIKNAYGSFFNMTNSPFNFVEINNNKVNNFRFTLFYFGSDNNHSFSNQLVKSQKLLVYEKNIVINDDDWWSITGNSLYHCCLLCECSQVIFRDNHTEGLKTETRAVYDAYLSADDVLYENNIWKNNVMFNDELHKNNILMKAKEGKNSIIYRNNSFTVDRNYPLKVGKNESQVSIKLFQMTDSPYPPNWIVENNEIDVYRLVLLYSNGYFKNLTFNNNVIKTKYLSGAIAHFDPDTQDFQSDSQIIINNNIIESEEKDPITDIEFSISRGSNVKILLDNNLTSKFVVIGNIINVAHSSYVFNNIMLDELVFMNNKIDYKTTISTINFARDSGINTVTNVNNVFNTNKTFIPWRSPLPVRATHENNVNNSFPEISENYVLNINESTENVNVHLMFETLSPLKALHEFNFKIVDENGIKTFKSVDNNDELLSINIVDGDNDSWRLKNHDTGDSVRLGLYRTNNNFMIIVYSNGDKSMKFKENFTVIKEV